jgi:hypothetical protein
MYLWSNYKTITFHTIEGRYKLFLSGSHLRIQDMNKSLKLGKIIWHKMYRIDEAGCLKGCLSDFSEKFAYVLSECKTLEKAIIFIESNFLIE